MSEQQFSIGAYHEAQAFKSYLNDLSSDEFRKVAYELFVHLQNSRATSNSLKVELNKLAACNARLNQDYFVGIKEFG